MTRFLVALAFFLGAGAVTWIASGFWGSDTLALSVTLVISAVYILGFIELATFRGATGRLMASLETLPDNHESLTDWLATLPIAMQAPVRKRAEGEAAALPGPMLTPYLLGLLVMLGLLGTFAGMIVTLSGAASALEGSNELNAIRSALAAPIAGLSLAFGTSIAGVAASAMLGLASTLSRRERILASRALDEKIRQQLGHLSGKYRREQAYAAIEQQSATLPALVSSLHTMTARMEEVSARLADSLTDSQQRFHQQASEHYQGLALSVGQALQNSLAEGSKLAAESVQPIMTQAMAELDRQTRETQQSLVDVSGQQLEALAKQFQATTEQAAASWKAGLSEHQQHSAALMSDIASTFASHRSQMEQHTIEHQAMQRSGLEELITSLGDQLQALRDQEQTRADAADQRLQQLEAHVAEHLTRLGTGLEAPMTRLIASAEEAPRAAAGVIARMNEELARTGERENSLLEDRQRIIGELDRLLESQREATQAQHKAIETLIASASGTLADVSKTFSSQVQAQNERLTEVTAEIAGGSSEITSLSDAFQVAVERFGDSNQQLVDSLTRVESALLETRSRSDDQLAYYVEQAREVIELSTASQKEVIDALRALSRAESGRPVAEAR